MHSVSSFNTTHDKHRKKSLKMDAFGVFFFALLYSATDAGMTPGRMDGRVMRGSNEMKMRGMSGKIGMGGMGGMDMMGGMGMMGGLDGGGPKGINKNGEPQTYPEGIGMGGGIGGTVGHEREKTPSLKGMLDHLDVLDHLESFPDKIKSESMKTLVGLVTHQILDRVSCVTNCVNNNENNKEHTCHEQSCIIQYHPDVNS